MAWAEPFLICHTRTFKAAIRALRKLSPARRIILAVPDEMMQLHYRDIEITKIPSRYPASLRPMVAKAVTDEEFPENVGVVALHNLWSLGRVAMTKKPLIETVLTIGNKDGFKNFICHDGSTMGELFDDAKIAVKDGDTMVRGGPLRGESIDRLDRGVTKGTAGLFLVEKESVVPMTGTSACISCKACVSICTARLRPDLLSRNAEFGFYKRCLEHHLGTCFECGLCSYVCIARRPVLQYIRLAKATLGLPRGAEALVPRGYDQAEKPASEEAK